MTPHPVDLEVLQKLLDGAKPGHERRLAVYEIAINALPALLAEVRAARQALPRIRGLVMAAGLCKPTALVVPYEDARAALASPSVPPPQECVCVSQEEIDGIGFNWTQPPCPVHPAPPVLEEKAQEPAATPEGRLAQWAAGHDPYGPAAQETAAPKEGGEAIRLLHSAVEVLRFYAVDRRGSPFATAIDGSLAQGWLDAHPTLPALASETPRGAPPSAPPLPKGEVAPGLPCVHGRRGLCPHCFLAPAPLPEEQLPKDGTCETHQGLHERTAACVRWWPHAQPSGPAAAPAPGDADMKAARLLLGTGCVHEPDPATKAECVKCIAAEMARVRSDERERWMAQARGLQTVAGKCAPTAIVIPLGWLIRASDATSAGGGE